MKITILLHHDAAHPRLQVHSTNPVADARAAGLVRWLDRAMWVCVTEASDEEIEALEADPAVVVWG